jgi:hypothetical protein
VVFAAVKPNGYIPMRRRRRVAAIVGIAALTITALALVKLDPSALCALPALALPGLLALHRYPGERILAVLSDGRREPRQRPRSSVPFAVRLEVATPRGGLLLACSLAVRPPPSAWLAAS